jgi:hypothetical protein
VPKEAPLGITQASTKMLNQNNQYFYDNKAGSGKPPKNFNQYGGGAAALMDDANEDDFWYQTPKTGPDGVNAG